VTLVTNVTWFLLVPATAKRGASADVYINGEIYTLFLGFEKTRVTSVTFVTFIFYYVLFIFIYILFYFSNLVYQFPLNQKYLYQYHNLQYRTKQQCDTRFVTSCHKVAWLFSFV